MKELVGMGWLILWVEFLDVYFLRVLHCDTLSLLYSIVGAIYVAYFRHALCLLMSQMLPRCISRTIFSHIHFFFLLDSQ